MSKRRIPTVLPNSDVWMGYDPGIEREDNVSQDTRIKGDAYRDELAKVENQDTIYHCPFCDLQFGDKSGFQKHVRQNHAMAIADDAEKQRMAVEAEAAFAESERVESALSPAPTEE
jgi:uncharacterized C2H2 Zn-finger protein